MVEIKVRTNQKIIGFLSINILLVLLGVGCDRRLDNQVESSQATPVSQKSAELTVSAAASLKDAMTEIKLLYQQEHPETEITYNFGSSGSLQRQIEQGAPVDVFVSAAPIQMDSLEKQGLLLTETRRDLWQNQIVLIAPVSNQKIDSFDDLTSKEITTVALGKTESVPAGKYAQEVLTFFQIADQVKSKAVYGKDVRQVLHYVATENVDAGIVYRTDAQVSDAVKIVATAPENSHSPVVYPVAVIKDSDRPSVATELVEFLATPQAEAVFKKYGFTAVRSR